MAHTNAAIQPRGTVDNMLSMGMEDKDLISERLDNPLDAGASNIETKLPSSEGEQSVKNEFICADDADGMTKAELHESGKVNNSKAASDTRNGRFGAGGAISNVCLTQHNHSSTRLTKKKGTNIIHQ